MKDELKFKGKINSNQSSQWYIIGISYNPYSLLHLNITVSNGINNYKIVYKEDKLLSKETNTPSISAKNPELLHNFQLKVINKPNIVLSTSDNIEFFPTKKAS